MKSNRILVIGDLHEPFCLDGYLEFCQEIFKKHNCNRVVFIGDVIDNHYSSYHETDADGMGGGDELNLAISKLSRWYEAFPVADVTIGNHDRIIMRKAQTSSIPSMWIREYKDVLGTPEWNFVDHVVYDNVQYIHGEGGTARTKCRADMMSTVQGHLHTQCYTDWYVGQNFKIFGAQVGCGIDHDSYAMAYAKRGKKPAIGCAVVIDGKTCINELMEL
jgi:predicted phosphodiesterase